MSEVYLFVGAVLSALFGLLLAAFIAAAASVVVGWPLGAYLAMLAALLGLIVWVMSGSPEVGGAMFILALVMFLFVAKLPGPGGVE